MYFDGIFFLILQLLKQLRNIISGLVWFVVGLYLLLVIMVHIPMVQSAIGEAVASAISKKLGAPASVGNVYLGFFNRVIIDDVALLDQKGKQMLFASRLSAKISITDLAQGRIVITSAQIFTPRLNLYKEAAKAKPNFQFVIDSLASKDTTSKSSLTLAINSLVVRHGSVAWNQWDTARKTSFDTHHLQLSDISSHIIIYRAGGDSLNAVLKNLSVNEASGIKVTSLSMKVTGNKNGYWLRDMQLSMPGSEVTIPHASMLTDKVTGRRQYDCRLSASHIAFRDIAAFYPKFKKSDKQLLLQAIVSGSDKLLRISSLAAYVLPSTNYLGNKRVADVSIVADGVVGVPFSTSYWSANIRRLSVRSAGLAIFMDKVPEVLERGENLRFRGRAKGYGVDFSLRGELLSGVGNALVAVEKERNEVEGSVKTKAFDLGKLLADKRFGTLAADIRGGGSLKSKVYFLKGSIPYFQYNKYDYKNITVDADYDNGLVNGRFNIADDNIAASLDGSIDVSSKDKAIRAVASISRFAPSRLNLFKGRLAEADYKADIVADITGHDINSASGHLAVRNFSMKSTATEYALDSLLFKAGHSRRGHYLAVDGDFGKAVVYGNFDYASLPQSIENIIVRKLPGITNLAPFKYRPVHTGRVAVQAYICNSDWAKPFLNIPLEIREPLSVAADVDNASNSIQAEIRSSDIVYGNYHLKNVRTTARTVDNRLEIEAALRNMRSESLGTDIELKTNAGSDKLMLSLSLDNHALQQRLHGNVYGGVEFRKNSMGHTEALLNFDESHFYIGDSLYTIHPSTVLYSKKHLEVNDLDIGSNTQSIRINGMATDSPQDSMVARLKNVDVNYVLNLVNFHSVDFDGSVSGQATLRNLFDKPNMGGSVRVDNFRFMGGRLGILYANVDWNNNESQIDIDAIAKDTLLKADGSVAPRAVIVKGYVSPKRNYIDLNMGLKNTRMEFVGDLCSSFLDDVDLSANGNLRLCGDLKQINLLGDVTAHGGLLVKPIGTHYSIRHGKVHFIENNIIFQQDSVYDDMGHLGIVTGALHHRHLSRLSYDIDIAARNLLAFNFDGGDGSSFYGKVFGTGNATIQGRSGEVNIDVNMLPTKGSEVVYDATSPEALASQDFIHWRSKDSLEYHTDSIKHSGVATFGDIPANIHINLSIKANPEATFRIIMDRQSGDYVALNGSGDLRATYFNKGGLNIFGTYTVDHGVYNLTIQNIIKKNFVFAQGGTIVFGGTPYAALLNLKAQYPIASVSLADLQVGRSFSSSNVRVNCLMDITGTPESPKVDFGLDFPTMSADTKQMVYSLINGEEEMRQQVLYLLAVGRFYSRGINNAESQTNQTSLAMQSILSGQLSQQINNIIGSFVKTTNWSFGANISTGDEGFNNAQYEGLLSGHLLNNRLLFNGQFGYRDKANATTSFIGDFDLRYLIFPNGNFSVHVYNQTNDRYFTRNSLNTQGVGFILKKDFGSFRELFGLERKKKKAKE